MEIKCTAGFSSTFFMFVCFFFSALNNTEELLIVGYVGFPHVCYRVGNQTNIRLFCFVVISFATALAEQIPMHRRRKVEWNFQLLIVCRKRRKLSLSFSGYIPFFLPACPFYYALRILYIIYSSSVYFFWWTEIALNGKVPTIFIKCTVYSENRANKTASIICRLYLAHIHTHTLYYIEVHKMNGRKVAWYT